MSPTVQSKIVSPSTEYSAARSAIAPSHYNVTSATNMAMSQQIASTLTVVEFVQNPTQPVNANVHPRPPCTDVVQCTHLDIKCPARNGKHRATDPACPLRQAMLEHSKALHMAQGPLFH